MEKKTFYYRLNECSHSVQSVAAGNARPAPHSEQNRADESEVGFLRLG